MSEAFEPPGYCPICGEHVPRGALACPGCGACSKTGWSGDAVYDGLSLPETDDDDEQVEGLKRSSRAMGRLWSALVFAALAVLLLYLMGRR